MTRISMPRVAILLTAMAFLTASSINPATAEDRWEHHGGWGGGHERHDWGHGGGGIGIGGALLGLGVGAAVGAAIAGQPRVYAPPPPAYYPPPPAYYTPPPAYYGD